MNNNVIGVHKAGGKLNNNWNLGTFMKGPIEVFNKNFSDNKEIKTNVLKINKEILNIQTDIKIKENKNEEKKDENGEIGNNFNKNNSKEENQNILKKEDKSENKTNNQLNNNNNISIIDKDENLNIDNENQDKEIDEITIIYNKKSIKLKDDDSLISLSSD